MTAPPLARRERFGHRIKAVRTRVRRHRVGRVLWRAGIIIVATVVILFGVVLLAIPGPGWLVIFAGLGILSTEFDWAARLLRWARGQVSRWTRWVTERPRWIQALIGLVGLLFLGAILVGGWLIYF